MHRTLILVASLTFVAADASHAAPLPGLTLGPGGAVLREGRPYRGLGINYFSCFLRCLYKPADTSYEAGFQTLAEHGIPFARFCACGFWPRDMRLYQEDRAEYFRLLDGVVRCAERRGLGLIPSLFWHHPCVPDLVGEPCNQWGNPQSKTHAFMRQYVQEVVTRYKDSPAIWAWEFGNEYNLAADLPNAAEHRPAVWPKLGTAAQRTEQDDLTSEMLVVAWREFAREVRKYDAHRLIGTGNSILRDWAWHNRSERSWKPDTPEQFAEMLTLCTPEPIDLISVHCYEKALNRVEQVTAAARQLGKPLFVGEFQVNAPDSAEARPALQAFLAELDRLAVPLAAVWVFDLPSQEKDFNISASNGRAWQLPVLGEWNKRLQSSR